MRRYFVIAIIILLIFGCSELGNYTYNPYIDIKVDVRLKKLKAHPKLKATFLYFEIQMENNVQNGYYFHPGLLKAKLNGEINESTWYDSLASGEIEKVNLLKGKNTYNLYFVFPESVGTTEVKEFQIIDFGLSKDKGVTYMEKK